MLTFLSVLGVYLALGLAFAIWFVFVGVRRIDPVANDAGLRFRLLILPGATAFWPVLLRKCVSPQARPEDTQ